MVGVEPSGTATQVGPGDEVGVGRHRNTPPTRRMAGREAAREQQAIEAPPGQAHAEDAYAGRELASPSICEASHHRQVTSLGQQRKYNRM